MVNANEQTLTYKNYCDNEQKQRKNLSKKKQNNTMAKYSYFYMFLLGGFLGTIYEEVLQVLSKGYWESRAGMLWLPFNPLYGFGALAIVLILSNFKEWYHQITYGAILGGAVEYLCSWGQEIFTGTSSWNYNGVFTNIDGRTTVVFALAWGFLGFALVRYVYPLVVKLLEKIPLKYGQVITIVLMVVFIVIMIISYSALIRCFIARQGVKPLTFIGEFLDKWFPQSYLQKCFPNMKFK